MSIIKIVQLHRDHHRLQMAILRTFGWAAQHLATQVFLYRLMSSWIMQLRGNHLFSEAWNGFRSSGTLPCFSYAMLYYARVSYAMLYYTMLCHAMRCLSYATLRSAMLCYAMLCNAAQSNASAMLWYAVLHCFTMILWYIALFLQLCYFAMVWLLRYCYSMLCCAFVCHVMPCYASLCHATICFLYHCILLYATVCRCKLLYLLGSALLRMRCADDDLIF